MQIVPLLTQLLDKIPKFLKWLKKFLTGKRSNDGKDLVDKVKKLKTDKERKDALKDIDDHTSKY